MVQASVERLCQLIADHAVPPLTGQLELYRGANPQISKFTCFDEELVAGRVNINWLTVGSVMNAGLKGILGYTANELKVGMFESTDNF